jgi:hypothetical protein
VLGFIRPKDTRLRLVSLYLIRHSCSCLKQYFKIKTLTSGTVLHCRYKDVCIFKLNMAHWHMQVFRNSRSRERYVYSKSQSECVRRRRSRCPSGRKSAKDRKLVRLLVYKRRLEDKILRKWSQKWGNSAEKMKRFCWVVGVEDQENKSLKYSM